MRRHHLGNSVVCRPVRRLGWLVAMALLPTAAASQAGDSQRELLLALRSIDVRVATIGYRLAAASVDLCNERTPLAGIFLHDLAQYSAKYRESAIRSFGLGAGPSVLAVAVGSPADAAGIKADDRLVAIDGRVFMSTRAANEAASFSSADAALALFEREFADGAADVTVGRAGTEMTLRMQGRLGCVSRFQVVPGSRFGASADGRYVQLTSSLAARVDDDGQLAAVLAHELAHNILQHRVSLNEAGVSRGMLKIFGRNARLIRETEKEADLLSVYLLARAGYPPTAASAFWLRFGPERPWGPFGSPTHPGWKDRARVLDAEAEVVGVKITAGLPLVPDFMAKHEAIAPDGL